MSLYDNDNIQFKDVQLNLKVIIIHYICSPNPQFRFHSTERQRRYNDALLSGELKVRGVNMSLGRKFS